MYCRDNSYSDGIDRFIVITVATENNIELDKLSNKKINVIERIPIESKPNETNYNYLKTKKDQLFKGMDDKEIKAVIKEDSKTRQN